MKEFTYIVKNEMGLHARPASELSAIARSYKSDIYIIEKKRKVNAKRIVDIMEMNIRKEEEIKIQIEGKDEDEVLERLKEFCVNHL